ncbi:MAG: hypothetical protein V3T88_08740 [Nitrosomonadaceae bacterium]
MVNRAAQKAKRIAQRFKEVCQTKGLFHFWTLTFYSQLSDLARMDRFNAFMMSLREYYPGLQYLGVKELHPGGGANDGTIHLHCLFDRFVSVELVLEIWESVGAGQVVWVDKVCMFDVVRYITKYVVKSIECEEVRRPVIASRNFCIHLTNFLKWTEKLCTWGKTYMLEWIVDNVDFKEYNEVACRKKRNHMARIFNLAVSLETT